MILKPSFSKPSSLKQYISIYAYTNLLPVATLTQPANFKTCIPKPHNQRNLWLNFLRVSPRLKSQCQSVYPVANFQSKTQLPTAKNPFFQIFFISFHISIYKSLLSEKHPKFRTKCATPSNIGG